MDGSRCPQRDRGEGRRRRRDERRLRYFAFYRVVAGVGDPGYSSRGCAHRSVNNSANHCCDCYPSNVAAEKRDEKEATAEIPTVTQSPNADLGLKPSDFLFVHGSDSSLRQILAAISADDCFEFNELAIDAIMTNVRFLMVLKLMDDQFVNKPKDSAADYHGYDVPFPFQHSNKGNNTQRKRKPFKAAIVRKESVESEPNCKIQNDADNRGRDGRKRRREPDVTTQSLDVRAAQENPEKAGCESRPSCKKRADGAGQYW